MIDAIIIGAAITVALYVVVRVVMVLCVPEDLE